MNGFELRKKKKMESILLAARELFCQKGIKAVTITEIAKKAQVSPVSIYNFFESKDNLVKEVVFSIMDEQMKVYEELLDSELPFKEKFEKMVFMKMEAVEQFSSLILQSPIWNEPFTRNIINHFYETKTIPLTKKFIEQGKKEGFVNPDISTESIVLYVDMFKSLLERPMISKQEAYDLIYLCFFGLLGKTTSMEL
ncbi:TetR/AcrR family transcriptional regulator [Defluviitalea saccharophila]|uniref:TetR/AcrR family transcriptional regulator n=1 Tax=Defluviitalea saccharophila TaxID=879970 RepID=A0ABZ2Y7D8_9FIRM|nr:TetR/AcrR family transcriptional regulator [Candidatus Epulonipiscium sp.]